ncbi:flavodoxin domain-containing protein [Kosmotoga arenicorallina]|nr:flavodoxin domain-containing protein [Kosmotoga arenicorallina]
MKEKRIMIAYISKHRGNTYKIAKVISNELGAEIKKAEEVAPEELLNYDLIGLGSGIYAFGMHGKIKKLLKKSGNGNGKKVFLISTSGDPNGSKYHKGVKKILEKKNFKLVGEFNCPGAYYPWLLFGKKGINADRPNSEDIEKAKEFAREIMEKWI